VIFVETQGRENLYDVRLPDGSVLRSIQPVRGDVKVGDAVTWAAAGDKIMVFAEDGARL
jgi:inositol-phosphate transport system ATP-binding protein